MAPMGAVVNQAGAWAWLAWPTMVARGSSPRRSASPRFISTSAAPPSEIELELAAVTVPSLAKAGFSLGIFSGSVAKGCSSRSTTVSALRPVTVTGTISGPKLPSSVAPRARASEVMAKASWPSRVNW